MKEEIRYLSLCGMLGYGYSQQSLEYALSKNPDFIGVDAGSTDPGPYYLGSGESFVKTLQMKRDLSLVLKEAVTRRIPLIIGSAGGSGAKPHVDRTLEIICEIAKEQDFKCRIAVIYSDLDKAVLRKAAEEKRISSCGGSPEFDPCTIDRICNPVAQFGTEPIIEALQTGADIILAGRCCDTAVFASYPIMHGFPAGLALHAAKIAECGALCARPAGANESLFVTLRRDSFIVEPMDKNRKCTPDSVAAHSLYEQPDPNCFYEPEGMIDMRDSTFEAVDDRSVKISGTVLHPAAKNTVKLEGAAFCGFRSVTIAGVRDPVAIASLDAIEEGVRAAVAQNIKNLTQDYSLRFLRYGVDAIGGRLEEPPETLPREAALLIEAIAPTQELADTAVSLARSSALHQGFPNRKATAGNFAFPFSPSDLHGGEVYEFALYHLMDVENHPLEIKPVIVEL